jgi:predicted HAD superfamily hydrolase
MKFFTKKAEVAATREALARAAKKWELIDNEIDEIKDWIERLCPTTSMNAMEVNIHNEVLYNAFAQRIKTLEEAQKDIEV